jgi:Na+/glutamate symporter
MASGFAAISLHTWVSDGHKTTDTVFLSLAFGLVASRVISLPLQVPSHVKLPAFGASLFAGVLWRTVMRSFVRDILRRLNYSWADDSLSAWDRLQEDSKNRPTIDR